MSSSRTGGPAGAVEETRPKEDDVDSVTIYEEFVKEEADAEQQRQRSTARPLAVFQEWRKRLASGAPGRLDDGVDVEGYTENCLGLTGWKTGFGVAFQNYYKNVVQPFAEQVAEIVEVVEGEHAVVVRMHQSGKHVGECLGVAPTGRRVTWDSVVIVHVRGGRVVDQWAQMDLHGLFLQLTSRRGWAREAHRCPHSVLRLQDHRGDGTFARLAGREFKRHLAPCRASSVAHRRGPTSPARVRRDPVPRCAGVVGEESSTRNLSAAALPER
jgi:predicted ester cyclase